MTSSRGGNKLDPKASTDDPAAIPYDVPSNTVIPPFGKVSAKAQCDLGRVWEAVAGARRIVVICGAGVSVSSPANIPDFRSTAGLFRKLKEKHPNAGLTSGKDLFDASLFNSSSTSSLFYSMISELKAMADAAAPTTFHHFLKRLDLEGRLLRVYTQNIDGLEEKAGLTFGLGETGDSRAALRALGKRKREVVQRNRSLARSKSDSAVLLSKTENVPEEPMFPRAIPLHGSLSTMTCQVCGHKVYLSLASSGNQVMPRFARELSPDAGTQATAAMDLLSQGEPVPCKQCEAYAEVRSIAGLRSRGVGLMKVDVVLYNGQNDGAERVGDCVERDILGLRDPNETAVPESSSERAARERKERKEGSARRQQPEVALQPIQEAVSADDAFSAAFAENDEAQVERELTPIDQLSPPAAVWDEKPKKQMRLKPLPPDLLIVAGTSLKVPGTKRIVREFAKACQARDHRVYPDSDDESGSETKAKDVVEEEQDIHAPIRTILLNYDFPLPHSSWDDVFDVWVQGDVQQAALGLWEATKYPAEQPLNGFSMQNGSDLLTLPQHHLWTRYCEVLEAERKREKESMKNGTNEASLSRPKKASISHGSESRNGSKPSTQAQKATMQTHKTSKATVAAGKKNDAKSPVKKKNKASSTSMAPPLGALDKHVQRSKAVTQEASLKSKTPTTARQETKTPATAKQESTTVQAT